jgi:hypothetical protein
MPHIGFEGYVFGALAASVSTLNIAIYELGKVYKIWGSGAKPATGLGNVRSTEFLGSFIPDIDDKGRHFPNQPVFHTLVFTIAPGFSIQSPHRVKIKFQSLVGSQSTIYEWEGRIPLNSSAVGGFGVDGTINRINSDYQPVLVERNQHRNFERHLFNQLLWIDHYDDSLRELAREQEANQRRGSLRPFRFLR